MRHRKPKSQLNFRHRKDSAIVVLAMSFVIILVAGQNCSTLGPVDPYAQRSSAREVVNAKVSAKVIQDTDGGQSTILSFKSDQVVLEPERDSLVVDGLCSKAKSGAKINWQIVDGMGAEYAEGLSVCNSGAFKLQVAANDSLFCERDYLLMAQFDSGDPGTVIIRRHCR